MQSALYCGRLRHRRFSPRAHAFAYRVCMVWIDLSELDEVFRGRWFWSTRRPALAWLRRRDLLGDPAVPLDQAVRDCVEQDSGRRPHGPIRVLTQLRTFGHCFNPVSFYYCYEPRGQEVEATVAEVTNTPWGERHAYVLPASGAQTRGTGQRHRLSKVFHVSPFMPMEVEYDWWFNRPGKALVVHMQNRQAGNRLFDATLTLRRQEITGARLAATLMRYPLPTWRVLGAIYWHALRLWFKRVPVHTHPAQRRKEHGS